MLEIEKLLKTGADVNTSDKNNFTLLMSFVDKGDEETVKVLLDYGANVNAKDFFNLTALDYSIRKKYLSIAKLLVASGAVITNDNYMFAVEGNHKELVDFFDTLDPNKHIFLKNRMK
jgi:ankyrin repeat protein